MVRIKKEIALDDLDELVDRIDNAVDLYKIGGLPILLGCLKSPFPSVRSRAAHVLATTVQNNPKCQQWALEQKGLSVLVESLKLSEKPNEEEYKVLEKVLYALAGLTRGFQPAQHAFVQLDGIALVVNLLVNPETSLRVKKKALLALHHFVKDDQKVRDKFSEKLVPALSLLIGNEDIDLREQVVKTLLELGKDQKSLQVLKDEKSKINERVEGRLKYLRSLTTTEDREQAEDEITLLISLLQRLKSTPPTSTPPSKPKLTQNTNNSNSNSSTSTSNSTIPNGTKKTHKNKG